MSIHALETLKPCADCNCSSLYSIPVNLESENTETSEVNVGMLAMPHCCCDYIHSN